MSLVAGPHASTHGRRATPASMHHPTVFGPHASTHDHLLSYQLVSGPHASLHGRRTMPSDHAQPTVFGPHATAHGRRTLYNSSRSPDLSIIQGRRTSHLISVSSDIKQLLLSIICLPTLPYHPLFCHADYHVIITSLCLILPLLIPLEFLAAGKVRTTHMVSGHISPVLFSFWGVILFLHSSPPPYSVTSRWGLIAKRLFYIHYHVF